MKKPKKKGHLDFSQLAKAVVDVATDESDQASPTRQAASGRLGGIKGGASRASKLTKEQRVAIARKAAAARWVKRKSNPES